MTTGHAAVQKPERRAGSSRPAKNGGVGLWDGGGKPPPQAVEKVQGLSRQPAKMPLLSRRAAAEKSSLRSLNALSYKAFRAFDPTRGGLPPPRAPPLKLGLIRLNRGFRQTAAGASPRPTVFCQPGRARACPRRIHTSHQERACSTCPSGRAKEAVAGQGV